MVKIEVLDSPLPLAAALPSLLLGEGVGEGYSLMNDAVIKQFLDMLLPLKSDIKELYLFGSRCRDDWRPDSDYDVLIVVDRKGRELRSRLYDAVLDILLDTGRLVSLKIFTLKEFERLKAIPTPFLEKVLAEGIRLGSND